VEAPATAARPSATEVRTDAKAVAGDPARGQGYFLQVGAFASEKAARDQVERIRRLGATAFTERIRTQQGERIRVRLGPFPTRDASDGLRQRLRSAGIDVTVVSP
jgi:DedD protein